MQMPRIQICDPDSSRRMHLTDDLFSAQGAKVHGDYVIDLLEMPRLRSSKDHWQS
jgi:hypothetical protein